ncbi:hypothetical protein CSPX01_06528 [Colletotrichum filicis]|nr:hypothetical protein CSPX01_06528 [Colletotrichum filicis]
MPSRCVSTSRLLSLTPRSVLLGFEHSPFKQFPPLALIVSNTIRGTSQTPAPKTSPLSGPREPCPYARNLPSPRKKPPTRTRLFPRRRHTPTRAALFPAIGAESPHPLPENLLRPQQVHPSLLFAFLAPM